NDAVRRGSAAEVDAEVGQGNAGGGCLNGGSLAEATTRAEGAALHERSPRSFEAQPAAALGARGAGRVAPFLAGAAAAGQPLGAGHRRAPADAVAPADVVGRAGVAVVAGRAGGDHLHAEAGLAGGRVAALGQGAAVVRRPAQAAAAAGRVLGAADAGAAVGV